MTLENIKKIIYHHRTRAKGAEGVHIRGVQNAFVDLGYKIVDISLIKANSVKKSSNSSIVFSCIKEKVSNLVTSFLPNVVFKILEILYNIYPFGAAQLKLIKFLGKKEKPEFIYERYAYFGFALAFLSKIYKIPLILEVNTTCLDYDVRPIRFRWFAKRIENFIFKQAKLITVVSSYLKKRICNEYGIRDRRVLITPNAIDPREFVLRDSSPSDKKLFYAVKKFVKDKFTIGFVGIFVPWHGLDFLLDVFSELYSTPINDSLGLLLVGDGPVRKDIEEKIRKKSLQKNVFITGVIPHEEIKYFINLFDIAIMPDSNPFGSPIKIFEYMVMGKPIVAPAYTPIIEVLSHRKTGLLFSPKDKSECLKELHLFMRDSQFREILGKRAKHAVLTNYTWKKNVESILSSLDSV
mgnify:CR=1 FL=1